MNRFSEKTGLQIALAVAALAAVSASIGAQDTISTTTGRRIRGVEITALNSSAVQFNQDGTTGEVPASQVLEIRWGDAPESYQLGRGSTNGGNFDAASDQFAQAAQDTSRAVLKTECEFLAAEALSRAAGSDQGKAQRAADMLGDWLGANPDNFRAPDALMARGRALLGAGSPAQAETTFKTLADDSLAKNWAPIWNARAKVEQARALMAAENFAGARTAFRGAASAAKAVTGAEYKSEVDSLTAAASVGVGETMIREGNFKDALDYFRELGGRDADLAVKAAAKAGEGQALFLQAQAKGGSEGLRGAQLALATASVLDPLGGETSAKALYYSGMVLIALGPDRETSTFKQRAFAYFETVVKFYGSTSWATLAAEELRR